MTPELAEHIITQGLPSELQALKQTLSRCYQEYTPEAIGQVFGYIRAEFTLKAQRPEPLDPDSGLD